MDNFREKFDFIWSVADLLRGDYKRVQGRVLAAAANVTTTIHQIDGRDLCRVHVEPSGHPVEAEFTTVDDHGQFSKERSFFVRLNNATRAISEERERQRYIAQRWAR